MDLLCIYNFIFIKVTLHRHDLNGYTRCKVVANLALSIQREWFSLFLLCLVQLLVHSAAVVWPLFSSSYITALSLLKNTILNRNCKCIWGTASTSANQNSLELKSDVQALLIPNFKAIVWKHFWSLNFSSLNVHAPADCTCRLAKRRRL